MANEQYYEKVAGDDSGEPLVGNGSNRAMRAPPTSSKKRSKLTTVAYGAVAVTVFVAAVGLISSAVVSYRLPAATQAALGKTSVAMGDVAGMGGMGGMGDAPGMGDAGMGGMDDPTKIDTGFKSGATGKTEAAFEGAGDHKLEFATDAVATTDEALVAPYRGEKHQPMKSCGSNADEARAAGCVYDVMMQLWTPPECMDTALSERFLKAGNWSWYGGPDDTLQMSDEEIRKGNHDVVYVAQSYHRNHCIFAWERLVRAMRNKSPLIQELISYDHVMHCRHKTLTLVSEGADPNVRGVIAPTGFTKCASYDVWINNLPANKISSVD